MANSANPEINKKIATSALGTLVIATVFFYLGDRYAETLVTYPGQIFDHLSDAFLSMWQTIKDESVQDCSDSGVQLNNQAVQLNSKLNTKLNTNLNTHLNTLPQEETAGSNTVSVIKGGVQNMSRPKNIDDRYKNTSTSTAVADGEGATDSGIPTREEVRSHFAEMGFAVDPDRFFDVNEGRGWRTNSGKPVDDWKKLAAVWDRNERPKAATPPARTEPKANAVGKIPSVEEVMAKWGCDRETAQGYIDENMY